MQLSQLKRHYRHHRRKIVGRGGKRGTTAGRGTKGQKARAGHRIRPESRDLIKKLPKRRGYRFPGRQKPSRLVKLGALGRHFAAGEVVSPETLADKGLIREVHAPVKILADGKLMIKLTIERCCLSAAARQAIIAAGGLVK
ncbi:MAG: 50S ribosomal protein L15 [Candidatus Vogelbacteria bacterium]|nr:50S ribosomal protein L15 [Candidatus Vogelbacteria bacterium]